MPKPLHPDDMSAAERIAEVGEILASGVLRRKFRLRRLPRRDAENPLDCADGMLPYGDDPSPQGETT